MTPAQETSEREEDLVWRLRNPLWVHCFSGSAELSKEATQADLAEAANEIDRLRALRAAGDAPAWQPIETAPADVQLLLGWWHEWPTLEWQMTADQYSNTRGGWRHSWATHWMPLPAPFPRPQRNTESSAPK